ncbi:MAG: cytidylate kinase family protein [Desulfobacteraceae bacterium]|nr:cytidylate kinase family protein [Desulfobacteraceae bacterium]
MPVIFISRGTMAGVHRLVDCLHDHTGVRCISVEDLEKIVNQHGELATRIVEKLASATSAYAQFSELRWPYIVLLRQAMLEEIRHDNLVYHGYSSHLLLPSLCHFIRVRIEAPMNMRMEMTMQRLGCDEEKAGEYIREKDDQRVKWARFMYAQDIRNTMLYDLTLNMGHMTLNAACGIIENLLKEPDFQATPESRAEVDRLYLATTIEEALVTDTRTSTIEIRAVVDKKDGIRLIGPYLDAPEIETVIEIAKSVPGVDAIQYITGYSPQLEIENPLKL